MKLRNLTAALAMAGLSLTGLAAHAGTMADVVKIGFISDMSGVYADDDGPGGATAIQMAIDDFGGTVNGKKIELLTADHQNKADIGAAKAREWMDQQHLDLLIGGTNSGVNLAMNAVSAEKHKIFISVGAGAADLTTTQCQPYGIHYGYDTVALAHGTGSAVVKNGGKNWFFITADYAFGHALQRDTAAVVKSNGGTVKGSVNVPLGTTDFSSYMLQAQSSGAQILGLANAGGDWVNSVKAADQFGITKTMKLATLLAFLPDVHAAGQKATQGMYLTASWYWDLNDQTRAWSKRWEAKMHRAPSMLQAGDYSAALTYLNAVKATGTDDADTVMKWIKSNKINDMFTHGGYVRADGTLIRDMYLMQVKTPQESKSEWDLYKVIATLPGEDVFTKPADSPCKLLKQ